MIDLKEGFYSYLPDPWTGSLDASLAAGQTVVICCSSRPAGERMKKQIDPEQKYRNQITIHAIDEESDLLGDRQ